MSNVLKAIDMGYSTVATMSRYLKLTEGQCIARLIPMVKSGQVVKYTKRTVDNRNRKVTHYKRAGVLLETLWPRSSKGLTKPNMGILDLRRDTSSDQDCGWQ